MSDDEEWADLSDLDLGSKVAAACGLLLLLSLFLPWYSTSESFGGEVEDAVGSLSAWQAFSFTDFFLFLLALAAIALPLLAAGGWLPAKAPPLGRLLLSVAGIAAALVFLRIVTSPIGEDAAGTVESGRRFGGWIALLAAAGIAVGARQVTVAASAARRRRPTPAA